MALFGRHGTLHAQTASSESAPKRDELQEVVVTGIRASVGESLEAKKDANLVQDVLVAEDIGKFPDKNLAEALQRVPGVDISRDFGEGERINLRGTQPTLTQALLNGHGLSTADWFILDQQNATRSFNYLMLPADLVGKVEVMKSAQADVQEGGIGARSTSRRASPSTCSPSPSSPRCRLHATIAPPRRIRMRPASSASRTRRTASASCWPGSTRSARSAVTGLRFSDMRS